MTKLDFAKLDNVLERCGVPQVNPKWISNKDHLRQADKPTNPQTD